MTSIFGMTRIVSVTTNDNTLLDIWILLVIGIRTSVTKCDGETGGDCHRSLSFSRHNKVRLSWTFDLEASG